ncbi:MAG TPA: GNAT family N-acetyltransferase [Acidimicrobiales bacterium]|nr:GNAT family N-acetyltransferase [Acidimicrobiales bacterium]
MPDQSTPRRAVTPAARTATDVDAEAMGAMFARAFADDPVWVWMCKTRVARFTRLAAPFFATETRQYLPTDSAWTVPGADAGALWAPPGAWRTSLVDMARWAPSALRLFGLHLPRSLSALAVVDKVHPREPHWYLALLGTDPDQQGTGLGSAVLRPVLERCDDDGLGAYLESSKEANVSFYERHGFEVTGRVEMGRDGSGPPMWTMWREPQVPGH